MFFVSSALIEKNAAHLVFDDDIMLIVDRLYLQLILFHLYNLTLCNSNLKVELNKSIYKRYQ